MSLREAVLAIADEMEECSKSPEPDVTGAWRDRMMSYVKQLRLSLKASEGEHRLTTILSSHDPVLEAVANREKERKLKQEMEYANRADASGPKMIEIVEEGTDTTLVDMPGDMPIGARTLIAGKVYQLKDDNKLHYDSEQTEKLRAKQK